MNRIDHITGPPRKRRATKGEADLRLDPQIGFCDPRPLTRNLDHVECYRIGASARH